MTASTKRQPREQIRRPDGTVAVQHQRPRADVLWYPGEHWPSVLVRRTHDIALARRLADECWAAQDKDVRPLTGGMRVGWWRTYDDPGTGVPEKAALDEWKRVVEWVKLGQWARLPKDAGPGVEFRP